MGSVVGGFMLLVVVFAIIIACTVCCVMWMKNKVGQVKQTTSMEMDDMHSTSTMEKKIDFEEVKA